MTFRNFGEMLSYYFFGIIPDHWRDYSEEPDRTKEYTVSPTSEFLEKANLSFSMFIDSLNMLNKELSKNELPVKYKVINMDDASADFVVKWDAHARFPFDGRGRTLAYTLVCERNADRTLNTRGSCSDVFFDPAEDWGGQIDTFTVLWHELLHSLSVDHHNNPRGLMFASYTGEHLWLHSSDVTAIRSTL